MTSNKKKKMSLFIVGMVLAQELTYTQAMAQQAQAPGTIVIGGQGAVSGFQSAGDYNINQTVMNFSQVAEKILDSRNANNQQDREYLQAISKRIAQSFQALVEKRKQFIKMSQDSQLQVGVKLSSYLALVNEINAMIDSIRIEIQTSSLISKDTLPSNGIKIGNQVIDTGSNSIIDMTKAMEPFLNDLNAFIEQLNNVRFGKLEHKGAWNSVSENALNPDLTKWPQMTPEEIQKAVEDIEKLSIVSTDTMRRQQFLADVVVSKVKEFIRMAGTEEFLRFRNDNDKSAFSVIYNEIEKAFFVRSYLRRKYGLQMGAIQSTSYPKVIFNGERVFKKEFLFPVATALNSIRSQTASADADLLRAFNDARQFVEQYDKMLTPILSTEAAKKRAEQAKTELPKEASLWQIAKAKGADLYKQAVAQFASKEEIMAKKPVIMGENEKDMAYNSDDTGFMARMSGLLTTVTGQVSTTEALLAVMRLVLADIREELMLSQADWSAMQSYHFKRFMNGNAQIDKSFKTMCDVDNTLTPDARARAKAVTNGRVTCTPAPTGIFGNINRGGANVVTAARNLITQYENVDKSRAIQARNLRNLVESAIAAGVQEGDGVDQGGLFEVPSNN